MNKKIDFNYLADELDFEIQDVKMLFNLFITNSLEMISKLKQYAKEKKYEQLYISAHALKGSASNLLFDEIYNKAKEIEIKAQNNEEVDYTQEIQAIENIILELKKNNKTE
ncbi:Hpt domain-containing protein [Arcobacter sp. FWKO B]|uniref:Hpt domain-containing protein n=1 Tax=Arcobacter sp. FWKO B TaxID=2593672 RepID=UPI0019067562|nr:Hpt domain-containing protein [Arcobacter sp. FWKO B]